LVADQAGSRSSCSRPAASAHCCLRWAVGVTTISAEGRCASTWRAATSANVVLPAPGVATARKSGPAAALKRVSAVCCHGRKRTLRLGGTLDILPCPSSLRAANLPRSSSKHAACALPCPVRIPVSATRVLVLPLSLLILVPAPAAAQ